jgi:hypothetical protein
LRLTHRLENDEPLRRSAVPNTRATMFQRLRSCQRQLGAELQWLLDE